MNRDILSDILKEVKYAKKRFPNWPPHPAAQAGIVCEEAGELMKACLELKYECIEGYVKDKHIIIHKDEIRMEAIQTAAMAIRFLENFYITALNSRISELRNRFGIKIYDRFIKTSGGSSVKEYSLSKLK